MNDIEAIKADKFNSKIGDEAKLKLYVKDLINAVGKINFLPTIKNIEGKKNQISKIYGILPSKFHIRTITEKYYSDIPLNAVFSRYIVKKAMRSLSGVLVSTVVLRPDVFSCPYKCSYCPTETNLEGIPTQPKSYLSTEPAMMRALLYNFDIRQQIWDRITTYIKTGNIQNTTASNKMEIIISGGTLESYPYEYRKQVFNDIYWAANTYDNKRIPKSLSEEITINETATYRVIGLTIETRPDYITVESIKDYRKWGVTRVQIGVQHYSDDILKKIKRGCKTTDTIRAIKLLKSTGFKVVCHLMPDLPGSSKELDLWMFTQAVENEDVQFDDVKIYPTAVCKSSNPNLIVKSDILDWHAAGTYVPYAETNLQSLVDVLIWYKSNVQPWIRIQRLIRDIPGHSIEAGYHKVSNLRQVIQGIMAKTQLQNEKETAKLSFYAKLKQYIKPINNYNINCKCIRCMEIGDRNIINAKLVIRKYNASKGIEYFISIETHKYLPFSYYIFILKYYLTYVYTSQPIFWEGDLNSYSGLIGFCRVRIDPCPGAGIFKVLENCALVREVHIYSNTHAVRGINVNSQQHKGYGQLLIHTAEIIARQNNLYKVAIIAGVGAREYYKNKCGYYLSDTYMIKQLIMHNRYKYLRIYLLLIILYYVIDKLYL